MSLNCGMVEAKGNGERGPADTGMSPLDGVSVSGSRSVTSESLLGFLGQQEREPFILFFPQRRFLHCVTVGYGSFLMTGARK
jgi:hypothetical protein